MAKATAKAKAKAKAKAQRYRHLELRGDRGATEARLEHVVPPLRLAAAAAIAWREERVEPG